MTNSELEKEEIKVLSDEGYSFDITYNKEFKSKEKLFFGLINKSIVEVKKVTETLRIEPLRLSTMDRIAKHQLRLHFDIERLQTDENYIEESNYTIGLNTSSMISIIALAVLGTDYSDIKFFNLKKKLSNALTSKQLFEITNQILALSDHVNFINSTRLMIARNPIKPNEVE